MGFVSDDCFGSKERSMPGPIGRYAVALAKTECDGVGPVSNAVALRAGCGKAIYSNGIRFSKIKLVSIQPQCNLWR